MSDETKNNGHPPADPYWGCSKQAAAILDKMRPAQLQRIVSEAHDLVFGMFQKISDRFEAEEEEEDYPYALVVMAVAGIVDSLALDKRRDSLERVEFMFDDMRAVLGPGNHLPHFQALYSALFWAGRMHGLALTAEARKERQEEFMASLAKMRDRMH